jgi:hypothetical protein
MTKTSKNILKRKGNFANFRPMPNKPFNSKFRPHAELIFDLRRKRKTWQEIADELGELGIKASRGNVCDFYRRYKARPNPMGWEPDHEHTISTPVEGNPNEGDPVKPGKPGANVRHPKSPNAERPTKTKTTTVANVPTAGSRTFKFGDPYAELDKK